MHAEYKNNAMATAMEGAGPRITHICALKQATRQPVVLLAQQAHMASMFWPKTCAKQRATHSARPGQILGRSGAGLHAQAKLQLQQHPRDARCKPRLGQKLL
jgi:hypothetical protein